MYQLPFLEDKENKLCLNYIQDKAYIRQDCKEHSTFHLSKQYQADIIYRIGQAQFERNLKDKGSKKN